MSSIPGPVVRLIIDAPGITAPLREVMDQVKSQARTTSQTVAEDWRRMAAQIRASIATEAGGVKDITTARQQLVGVLEKDISLLRQRGELNTKELATLKAQTLELERQKSFLSGGSGLTAATNAFLGQIKNMLAGQVASTALGGGILGSTAQAGFATLGGMGSVLAVFAAAGAGLTKMALDGGKLAVELDNLSHKTGMTVENVIKLRAASEALDLDFDKTVTGFRKFSREVTDALAADLPHATLEAKRAGEIFAALGVDVHKAALDPMAAMQQLAAALNKLPDGMVKTALAAELFGRGGLENLPLFAKLKQAMDATASSSVILAQALGVAGVKSAEDFHAQLVNVKQEFEALEISLGQHVLPLLTTFVGWINKILGPGEAYARTRANQYPEFADFVRDFASKANDVGQSSKTANDTLLDVIKSFGTLATSGDKAAKSVEKVQQALEKGFAEMLTAHPSRRESPEAIQELHDRVLNQILNPSASLPPTMPLGVPSITGPLTGLGSPGAGTVDAAALLKRINDEYDQTFKTMEEREREHYDEELKNLNRALELKLISQQEYADAVKKLNEDLAKQLEDKYKGVADRLFEDLIAGNTKGFSKALEKQIEDIVLEPVKKQFEQIFGSLFAGLNSTINGPRTGTGAPVPSIGWLGSIFGLGPGGTAGTFPGSLGLGGATHTTGAVAINTGQTGVSTPTMYVQAQTVNIGGSTTSTGGLGGGVGNFFGTAGLFPPFGNFFGNLNPFGINAGFGGSLGIGFPTGGGTGGGGILGGNAGMLVGGLLLGGLGAMHGSVSSEAMGAANVATALAKIFAGNATITQTINGKQVQVPLGQVLGQGFAGAGLLASGISQGGVGGAFEDIAGGAAIGTAIMPGIGTAVGAIAGAITGIIRGIFGGNSWAQQVQNAMRNQAMYLPPSETFAFGANGSISSTMGTGFGTSGGSAFNYALPANTAFWANAIYGPLSNAQQQELQRLESGMNPNTPFLGFPSVNPFVGQTPAGYAPYNTSNPGVVQIHFNLPGVLDAGSVASSLAPHAETIAQLVAAKVTQSSSGFAWAARRATALP